MTMTDTLKRRGLGAHLALAFAALSALLTLLLVGVIGIAAGDRVRSSIGEGLAERALQTADKLDRGMFERYREVRLIARRFQPDSGGSASQDSARKYLTSLQETYPYYAWIGAAGVDGKVVVSTQGMLEAADVSLRPWFQHGKSGPYVGDVHEALLLAKLLPGQGPEPMRFVDVAAPYFNAAGALIGVLGAHLSWQWAREVERSIIEPRLVSQGLQTFILGTDGTVLLGPPGMAGQKVNMPPGQGAGAANSSGFRLQTWADGKQYVVGYSKSKGYATYPGLGWTILVRQDSATAFAPVRHLQHNVLWSGIAIALLFSALGGVAASRISRPLVQLTEAAARVERDRALTLPEFAGHYVEVRALAGSLSALVSSLMIKERDLQELNQTLERRVERRTGELATALAEVRANEARIHTILETVQEAFIGVALDGRIVDWNPRAARMFGWSREEALGQPVSLIIPARLRDSLHRALAGYSERSQAPYLNRRIERIVVDRHGRELEVEATIGLAGHSNEAFYTVFLHDISERKDVERMKNEFISTVSHELRTPLTAIRISLGLLADGTMGQFEPDVKRLFDISYESCERLVRLINDMLDIEKIESGKMTFDLRVQPLRPVVEAALEATRAYAAPYQVSLQFESDGAEPVVALEADRITQVVVNLLSNAVKFSPPGASVILRIDTTAAVARLSVRDHGSGIPLEFQHRIFEKFAQADSTDTRQRNGTGLGLSICQQLVQAHGGQISFTTEPGKGTVFYVDLPLAT